MAGGELRHGVELSNLDQPLFDGAEATKRDLIDYLEFAGERLLRVLRDRPLSVVRVRPGQEPFMQKNLPKYTPEWVPRTTVWAESSRREITYALGGDLRTLIWFGNQRAVEYHATLFLAESAPEPTHLVLDLDPSPGQSFADAVAGARLIREALKADGLAGAVKTSGSKGLHVFVPLAAGVDVEDAAAATRAVAARAERIDPAVGTTAFIREDRHGKVFLDATRAGGATVAAAYSPRIRPGVTVSFPLRWSDLDDVTPADFTVRTVHGLLGDSDPWQSEMPEPQQLPADLVEEGHTVPVARVQAMHEGKRRARARRDSN
ncbi:ATP-dependent DNA ligase [Nocardia neocaledoniensis NBRC 108232]|uniref:DNA ligase D-like protein (Predicted polymerase) n=1 Tax=Nocardia neocaledoniensis TaxID=236511 RepID=A0A317NVT6_9NOCA|nr:ATP-dependent DNA ligase [Nocardia neocaledoniensis]PWV79072.1 DNA ligase D-like protein (predicted polymerase) [Nocardia neocaledoniensis]GEM32402.1 ATP-dependent DNA ligase [Nocardia neocaledoniensis NBRC 108232]